MHGMIHLRLGIATLLVASAASPLASQEAPQIEFESTELAPGIPRHHRCG